jgi:hypothetical protein
MRLIFPFTFKFQKGLRYRQLIHRNQDRVVRLLLNVWHSCFKCFDLVVSIRIIPGMNHFPFALNATITV